MSRNWPLIIEVLHQIHRHPETWNQASWAQPCGTQFCFAGHAITLAGRKFITASGEMTDYVQSEGFPAELVRTAVYEEEIPEHTRFVFPSPAAAHLLGLPAGEANALFNGGNSFADILMLLEGFARQDGITLPPELYLPLGTVPDAEPELTDEQIVAALDDLALAVAR